MSLKLLARSGTIFDHIIRVIFLLTCIVLALIMLSVVLEVVMRYFLDRPLIWTIEAVSFALVFITFLSAAWILKKDKHVKLDLVIDRLNPRAQAQLNMIIYVFSSIVWLVVTWYSGLATWHLFQTGERIETMMEPLKAPLVAMVPVGSFLLFIQSLRGAYGYLEGRRALSEQKDGRK